MTHSHDRPQEADHEEHAHRTGLRHAFSEVFGGHSHDVDQIDDALEADSSGRRALLTSLVILATTAAAQGFVVTLSGSVALLGDALHNVTDALTAVPLLIAFHLSKRPATKRFTYGYGRTEDVGGLFVVAMIALSAAVAAYEVAYRLIHPREVTHVWAVVGAGLVGFLGNEIAARYRIWTGRRIGSAALVADGLHARTDGFASLAVVLAALGVAAGWQLADAIVGLVITVAIVGVLRSALRQVGSRLLDAVDPDIVDKATASIARIEGIQDVPELRIRWIGHTLHAEASVVVPADMSLAEAHHLAHHAEEHLLHDVGRLTAATVHASPAGAHC